MNKYINLFDFKQEVNYKNEILSGLTVALALVPEAVAFASIQLLKDCINGFLDSVNIALINLHF